MAPRRRGLLKYIILIPIVWFLVVLTFSIRTESPISPHSHNDVHGHIVKRTATEESFIDRLGPARALVNRIRNALQFQLEQHADHDHPVEERLKAREQVDEMKAQVQVIAPEVNHDVKNPNKTGPGEMGSAVRIDKNALSEEDKEKFNIGWKNNAFNQYASDMISVRRSLADVRDAECKVVKFHPNLPDTSVIIIFHNEARSVLLRTIWSVLDRSPRHLLKEVIVVDDFSDKGDTYKTLEEDIKPMKIVRVLRTKKREGLIRARLVGAYDANGTVLVFLDSHCECAEGWLEPLLDPIARNPKVSTIPIIEIIDDSTFEFRSTAIRNIQVGGFDWNLIYNWHNTPEREMKRRRNRTDPIRSPTMAGGLFAINRAWFEELGMYDPGMDIWGGENLELSFKLWQCGGELVCAPCSHVGHVFRKRSPYSWPTAVNVIKKNTVRLAEVWLDDYKKYFYERINFDLGDYGDVSDRIKIRERLQCKPFKWFLDNIFPEQYIPGESLYYGEIRNQGKIKVCIDSQSSSDDAGKAVIGFPCHGQGGNQFFLLTKMFEIRKEDKCFDFGSGKLHEEGAIRSMGCHSMKGNQMWSYENKMLRHSSGNCIELSSTSDRDIYMAPCNASNTHQQWYWKKRELNSTST
ncbi:unnamed protein product [Adineta steineri]|uniref:Polypeptide N-acetylgalactosaminyltransferase n=1 Tax=Adineta steineri TaxID=433720 RepID=A0A818J934_9BILA|nr:unnamed protein product [Adineta steineri]CAF0762554.1 unnamed protein product [Adineta steineri]CAF3536545.1 unnamed protein product [Adineta steineri]CAF3753178.1 unnamed protein product [Adineta steineri]CAF3759516.1 unnamed protein product [Adineta steineri]